MEKKGKEGEGIRAHFNQALIELKTRNVIASGPSFAVPLTRGICTIRRLGRRYIGPPYNVEYRLFSEEKRLPLKKVARSIYFIGANNRPFNYST